MNIYHYHPVTGQFLSQGQADESPLEPGQYLIPANATEITPPTLNSGEYTVWSNGAWEVLPVPTPEQEPEPITPPEPEPPSPRILRLWTFREESDPLFFKAQRGEATMEEWLEKVNEIRERFPDPIN